MMICDHLPLAKGTPQMLNRQGGNQILGSSYTKLVHGFNLREKYVRATASVTASLGRPQGPQGPQGRPGFCPLRRASNNADMLREFIYVYILYGFTV